MSLPASQSPAAAPRARPPRVLFLVKSAPANDARRAALLYRWLGQLPEGSDYLFCIGGAEDVSAHMDGRILRLPGPDDYRHLPAKMKGIVAFVAAEPNLVGFDYFITLDDDVVVELSRLFVLLASSPDHFGNQWNGDPGHISGMLVGYSRRAFAILAEVMPSIPDTGPDDLLMSRAVRRPFASLNVMTDKRRFKPFNGIPTSDTIAVEISPFNPSAMREFQFEAPSLSPSDLPEVRGRVSFCLFGADAKYRRGACANLDLMRVHYPCWQAVFYTRDVDAGTLDTLRQGGATVIECDYPNMMFARFLACCEPGVTLCRDCDSRIGPREVRAVREWLASDKPFHAIRDHPEHIPGWAVVPGGLWGARRVFDEQQTLSLHRHLHDPDFSGWGGDQRWLAEVVWRPEDFFIHQYNRVGWMMESWNRRNFCGMRHDENGNPLP